MWIDLCIVVLYIQYGSALASLSHIESRRIKWNLRQIGTISSKVKKCQLSWKPRWKVFSNCKVWFLEYFPSQLQLIVKSNMFLTFEAGQDLLCCRYYINVWKTSTFKWSLVLTRIANHFLSFKSYEFLL